MSERFISYLRVSTTKQGESGLGLEAQREAIRAYVASVGGELAAEFIEVESGRLKSRPILSDSLKLCRRQGAILLVAKLDRLARNVAFIATLMEADVEFRAVDAPYANRLMLQILAAFAEHERSQIVERTRAALAAARARGVQLGKHGKVLARQNKDAANAWSETIRAPLEGILAESPQTLQLIADRLNLQGLRTRECGIWYPQTVARTLQRLGLQLV